MTRRVIREFVTRPTTRWAPHPYFRTLTDRERQVVSLVGEGLTNDEIAERLHVEVRPALRMDDLVETTPELAREGRSLPNGMPKPLDMALFLQQSDNEIAIPVLPTSIVRLGLAPLVWLARRRGLVARYQVEQRKAA